MTKNNLILGVSLFFGMLVSPSVYAQTITIGKQVWCKKNLDVSTFNGGDPIPEAKTNEEWQYYADNHEPAWCYYDNDPANGIKYGKLYNFFAVNDFRYLAPTGYHIPSDDEWKILENYLGSSAGKKMKSTSGWGNWSLMDSPKVTPGNGSNSSGFSGLPGGGRLYYEGFDGVGSHGYWWSSSEYFENDSYTDTGQAWTIGLGGPDYFYMNPSNKYEGYSVRCIKGGYFD